MKVCSEPGCPELVPCPIHPPKRKPDQRGTFHERGYDKTYYRNRTRVLREELVCWICGGLVDKKARGPDGPTADHVIPRSKGGTNARENLRLAHNRCNSRRQAR